MNKKGFTLIELLAVIVVLAVVMLIAVTAVGPMVARTRKSALATEGLSLIEAAQTAYNLEIDKGSSASFNSMQSVCFSLKYLNNLGLFLKNESDGYDGSIAVLYNDSGEYDYKYWITNGTYMYINSSSSDTEPEKAIDYDSEKAANINKCQPETTGGVDGPRGLPASPEAKTSKYDVICDETCE